MSEKKNIDRQNIELNDDMWNIYFFMLMQNRSLQIEEFSLKFGIHELKYNLHLLEKLELVNKNINNSYELVENKKLYVLLYNIYTKIRLSNIIRVFFLSLSLTSFLSFIIYLEFLPQNSQTTITISIVIFILTLTFCMIEVVIGTMQMIFMKKILSIQYDL